MKDVLLKSATILNDADAVFICAGAGMSVDSGLPNFHGSDKEAFWDLYPALRKKGLMLKCCSDPRSFETDPRTSWGLYGSRYEVLYITHHNLYDTCGPVI